MAQQKHSRAVSCAGRRAAAALIICLTSSHLAAQSRSAAPPPLEETQRAFQQVVQRVNASVVGIRAERRQFIAADERDEHWVSVNGSGVVISSNGQILTNEHVVQAAERIQVCLADGRTLEAKVVGSDPRSDFAVLQIPATKLQPARLGDGENVLRGQWALAMGNPFGLGNDGNLCVSIGVISNTHRRLPGLGDADDRLYDNMLQTTAAINPGNSGGPLFNIYGEVIGIVTAMHTRASADDGVGFALPLNGPKRRRIAQLQAGQTVEYGTVGILSMSEPEPCSSGRTAGARIERIEPDGAADRAGLDRDDIIVRVNAADVRNAVQLREIIGEAPVGSKLRLEFNRGREHRTVSVRVQRCDVLRVNSLASGAIVWRGLRFTDRATESTITSDERGIGGVVIHDVIPNSAAGHSGLRAADVIERVGQEDVRDVDAFLRVVAQQSGDVVISIRGRGEIVIDG